MAVAARMKIGEISKVTGIAVGSLRYYDSLGLLQSERGENGYRYYPLEAVHQVQLIKKAQALGFSLEDIGAVLNVHQRGDVPCDFVQSLLQEKIEQLEVKIQEMLVFKAALEKYRDSWEVAQHNPKPGDICPLIESVPLQM